ncbi:50S ribosomal protein L11 methyltransferase [uncultured Tateyamaria sp.]|uniref:50S ribosomal protein L11 methyltransferase n=1 Tax=uncultured Tateyamaria sp. TaxID=455651 RepID=UPI0026219F52|nr:50S ribosomal protein L11 methyltransferase [uncultured Tateyamaria sp.]
MNAPVLTIPALLAREMPAIADLRDPVRDHALESCIASLDLLAKTVIDLRGGVGVNAMRFAKYGAMRVFTLILDPQAVRYARQLIRSNGFEGVITVISKPVAQAQVDGDLPEGADILFADALDCGVFNEGGLELFDDIAALRGPMTRVLPEAVFQSGVMVHDPASRATCRFDTSCGFDLSCLNRMNGRGYVPVVNESAAQQLSPRVLCRRYDFTSRDCLEDRIIDVVATRDGPCDGLLTWFEAHYGQVLLCNRREGSLWPPAYHPLETPIPVRAGQRYRFQMTGDGRVGFLCDSAAPERVTA